MPMKFFHGCTALITGASSGLGVEFARQLAPDAHALVLTARRQDRLQAIKAELTRTNPNLSVYCYALDLADMDAVERFIKWLYDEGMRINLLINNAGLGDHALFQSSEWSKVKSMLDVNITALTRLTHSLLPALRTFEDAAILNVSSSASFLPVPQLAVYAATKAYVTSFSEALRAELRGTGVTVTALCPGPVDTEFGDVANTGHSGPGFSAPEFLKIPAERVVREALLGVERDKARVIPGWIVFLGMGLLFLVPFALVRFGLNASVAGLHDDEEKRQGVASPGPVR
jgi:short-subunit dehydrogenase